MEQNENYFFGVKAEDVEKMSYEKQLETFPLLKEFDEFYHYIHKQLNNDNEVIFEIIIDLYDDCIKSNDEFTQSMVNSVEEVFYPLFFSKSPQSEIDDPKKKKNGEVIENLTKRKIAFYYGYHLVLLKLVSESNDENSIKEISNDIFNIKFLKSNLSA